MDDALKPLRETLRRFAAEKAIPLDESLKWGQPSFAPPKRRGTPVRLGLSDGRPAFYVHCTSPVIDRFRDVAPEAETEGTRAFVPNGPDDPRIPVFLALAFTYRD